MDRILAVLVLSLAVTNPAAAARPNIVLIMVDDMGYSDLGCYGGATFCELAGVQYPREFKGQPVGPARGISLAPIFQQKPRMDHDELFYYFNSGKTALLQGDWKLVDSKELYHLTTDRIESNDLSQTEFERFEKMKARWAKLAKEYKAGKRGKKNRNQNQTTWAPK